MFYTLDQEENIYLHYKGNESHVIMEQKDVPTPTKIDSTILFHSNYKLRGIKTNWKHRDIIFLNVFD